MFVTVNPVALNGIYQITINKGTFISISLPFKCLKISFYCFVDFIYWEWLMISFSAGNKTIKQQALFMLQRREKWPSCCKFQPFSFSLDFWMESCKAFRLEPLLRGPSFKAKRRIEANIYSKEKIEQQHLNSKKNIPSLHVRLKDQAVLPAFFSLSPCSPSQQYYAKQLGNLIIFLLSKAILIFNIHNLVF